MRKNIGRILTSLTLLAVVCSGGVLMAAPANIFADTTKDQICQGVDSTGACGDNAGEVNKILTVIVTLLTAIIGIAAVLMIVYAGFQFITAGGDTAKVASAKNTIIYALVGLAVVILSQSIVRVILGNVKPLP